MLMPKRVKYRKAQRGRMRGKATRGSRVDFGDFGLKALEPAWITQRQIEAARVTLTRLMKPGRIMFEVGGTTRATAVEALRLASHKLPIKTRVSVRPDYEGK